MKQKLVKEMHMPSELKKEKDILYELGLESYEIDYLMQKRLKEIISSKWK
jgi:hypothetical protein